MASMQSPGLRPPLAGHTDPVKFPSKAFKFLYADPPRPIALFPLARKPSSPSPPRSARSPGSLLCRCRQPGPREDSDEGGGGPGRPRWDALIQDVVRSAVKRWDDYVSSYRRGSGSWSVEGPQESASKVGKGAKRAKEQGDADAEECGEDWDWDRWLQHFAEVEEQERLVLAIKSQLRDAIFREDYGDAAKLKLALAKATENDAVGVAMSELNRAIKEEHYSDAARIRDHAGAGLVGWWAGISGGGADPYGRIIHISAEYGKYVAKSYSPRQLATGRQGAPLFEVYFTTTNGEHKQQPAFLKRKELLGNNLKAIEKSPDFSSFSSSSAPTKENTLRNEDEKSIDDLNISDDLSSIQNILRDIIPGVRLKVLKVVAPGKVDKDIIAKVIEQIIEEDVDDNDEDLETVEIEDDEDEDDIEEIEIDAEDVTIAQEKKSEVSLNVVISALIPKVSADVLPENLIRVPARIEKRDYKSFSFIVEKDKKHDIERKLQDMRKMTASQRSADILISDLAKTITSKEKAHMKVLRDIGELINLAVNQKQNFHSLTGVTHFSRIEIPSTSDPLSGLYVGTHGMYSSNVLHLKRKFGQWKEDNALQMPVELEFYEYVEAIKLTGDPSVPAGQVAFRAKIGKRYQLPHKGIIPEEFGVVARYKGQGRLADPGFQNPRWVDGELVILDGKLAPYTDEMTIPGFCLSNFVQQLIAQRLQPCEVEYLRVKQ